jgi:hypothetical protein
MYFIQVTVRFEENLSHCYLIQHVGFVLNRGTVKKFSLQVCRFSPPMTHLTSTLYNLSD